MPADEQSPGRKPGLSCFVAVIPGRREASNPESRDSGSGAHAPSRNDVSEHRDVLQKRDHAEHDDDDAADLLGAAVERQHVDEVEHENNDEKGDEYADQ